MKKKQRIAIVGGGISGLSSAYHLDNDFDVTIFEQENYFGGHTDTHELHINGETANIDSGFIVFCKQFYPHFSAMLTKLDVQSMPTEMSFSAHNHQTGVIYNATSLNKLFCQRKNLIKPSFYRMLFDLCRFYKHAPNVLKGNDISTSTKQYLTQHRYSDAFMNDHLFPMISALWSATPERVEQFPIRHLVEFLHKHGMMKLIARPQWLVVKGGSNQYVKALTKALNCDWRLESPVCNITRNNNGVTITTQNQKTEHFDVVIIATHSDQALKLLEQPSADEQRILGKILYEENHVVVHTDENVMHKNKQSWASWNTVVPNELDPVTQRCCTANYWMNRLQNLQIKTNVFSTLNSHHRINKDKILQQRRYAHPIFTAQSVAAQKQKTIINGKNNTYYVGAYWGWGFHEDGARSAHETAQLIKQQLI